MTVVYADGAFDLMHYGHVNFLRQAAALGTTLIVGVCGDSECAEHKRPPIMNVQERANIVRACRYVDHVIEDSPYNITEEWINKYQIDIVANGDNYSEEDERYCYSYPILAGIYRRVESTPEISTTNIIQRIDISRL